MNRFIYALGLGLLGAGIIHISTLLLIPKFADDDAWARISALENHYRFVLVEPSKDEVKGAVETHDPFFSTIACRFNLGDGVAHITAPDSYTFWSVSIFNARAENIYSFNDRNATEGNLNLAIATPIQMVELRKDLSSDFVRSIFVEADMDQGMVIVRVFKPDVFSSRSANQMLENAACVPVRI